MDKIKSNGAEIVPHCRDNDGFAYLGYSIVKMLHTLEHYIRLDKMALNGRLKWHMPVL